MKTQSIKRKGEHDRRHEKIWHVDRDTKERKYSISKDKHFLKSVSRCWQ